jgi:hypothetical protein
MTCWNSQNINVVGQINLKWLKVWIYSRQMCHHFTTTKLNAHTYWIYERGYLIGKGITCEDLALNFTQIKVVVIKIRWNGT